jgi:hypothetical protein
VVNIKKAIYEGLDMTLPDGLLLERKLFIECLQDPESQEIMRLYVESGQDREAIKTTLEKLKAGK